MILAVVGGPEIEHGIGTDEQQVEIGIGPECAHFGLEVGVVKLVRAILGDPRGCGVRPGRRAGIGVQLRRGRDVRNRKAYGRKRDFAGGVRGQNRHHTKQ